MADSPLTVSRARYALTLRLAHHVDARVQQPDAPSALGRVIDTTNDLLPLFAAYEASVRAEALRDVRVEVYRTLTDRLDALQQRTNHPAEVGLLDELTRWAQREQLRPGMSHLTGAG